MLKIENSHFFTCKPICQRTLLDFLFLMSDKIGKVGEIVEAGIFNFDLFHYTFFPGFPVFPSSVLTDL